MGQHWYRKKGKDKGNYCSSSCSMSGGVEEGEVVGENSVCFPLVVGKVAVWCTWNYCELWKRW